MRESGIRSRAIVAVVVMLVATTACESAGPVEVTPAAEQGVFAASMAGGAHVMRPLRQTSSGLVMPVGACADGIAFVADGTGVGTHVGRFDISLAWCLNPTTGAISTGDAIVVAANGDRIVMTLSGQAISPTELAFNAGIVGGTGRFGGASGDLAVTGYLGAAGDWTSTGTGWISY